MMLSKTSFDCYNKIKHLSSLSKLDLEYYLQLNQIYAEITGRPISKGCVNCVSQAWLIVNNWADKFYNATAEKYAEIKVVEKVKKVRKPRVKKTVDGKA
jgi:hypothetical protein